TESESEGQEKEETVSSTNNANTVSSTNNANTISNMPILENNSIFDHSYDEDVGAKADMNNLDTTIQVSSIPTTRIRKDHPLDQVIGDL
ncbi:hypothetical protein Tco_0235463, partial [Tanacetum coccineum]